MDYVHKVVMDKYMQGRGVEGNSGIYKRVQEIKHQLIEELTPEMKEKLQESPLNKILLVTHSRVLQAFSASGIKKVKGVNTLVDARYFQNCEVVPFKSAESKQNSEEEHL